MTASNGGALRLLWALAVKHASFFVLDLSLQTSHYKPQKAGEWMNRPSSHFIHQLGVISSVLTLVC